MFAGIVTALLVCDDYEQQTIKNIYARGYSRSQVYFSKLISVFLAVTVMFALADSLLKSETVVLANWWVAALPAAFSGQTAEVGRFAGCFLASLLYILFCVGGTVFSEKAGGCFLKRS